MVLKILRSKKFAKRTLLGLSILIIPAFVLWGIGNVAKGPEVIGIIGNKKIYTDDLAKSHQGIKTQLLFSYGGNYNAFSQILKNQPLLNYMAWERLILLSSARGNRFRITNKNIVSFISQHPLFQRNGVFDNTIYQFVLRNVLSMDARQFEELLRENLRIDLFRQNLIKDVSVSDNELKDYFKNITDKVTISYLLIDKESFSDKVSVSDEEIALYYEDNKETFFEEAKAKIDYIEMPFDSTEEKNSAINILRNLLPELRNTPEKFKEKAEEHNLKYGAPLPFSRNDIIPNIPVFKDFVDTSFTLKPDEISSPVINSQEDKGVIYILHKIQDIPREQKTLDTVHEIIVDIISDTKSLDSAKTKADALFQEITENNLSLKQAAEKSGQTIQTIEPVKSTGYIENIGPANIIVSRAKETGKNKIIPPIPVKNGVLIAHVDEIISEQDSVFEEKKEDMRKQLLNKKQIDTLRTWFDKNKASARLKKPFNEI
ncbi:MAG: peptidylprolyl isomerase [Candidatus Omnitrophota bacterium]